MNLQDRMYLHAQRILTDGLPHSPCARAWAREVLEMAPATSLDRLARAMEEEWRRSLSAVEEERYGPLSLRELSLGAMPR